MCKGVRGERRQVDVSERKSFRRDLVREKAQVEGEWKSGWCEAKGKVNLIKKKINWNEQKERKLVVSRIRQSGALFSKLNYASWVWKLSYSGRAGRHILSNRSAAGRRQLDPFWVIPNISIFHLTNIYNSSLLKHLQIN